MEKSLQPIYVLSLKDFDRLEKVLGNCNVCVRECHVCEGLVRVNTKSETGDAKER